MLRYADSDLPASALLPERGLRQGKLLAFDSAGNPTVRPPVDEEALATYVPPGAGATARPVRDKLADLVSVKDFGAVGDGLVDDTLALQAALTSARAVFVPPGTYRIANTLTLGYGQTLYGVGQASVIRGASNGFDLVHLPDGYATLSALRLERGRAGVRLFGRDGPCVQNALADLTLWEPETGLLFDGYDDPNLPCYWNNIARVLVAQPSRHGVWLTRTGAGDTPNANRFHSVRVYSLSAPMTGCGFFVEQGRFNNAFFDCEANLWPEAEACFRVGPVTDKTLIVNFYAESLGGVPNLQLDAGSVETAVVNLFSASAGPAILDRSGGRYTAVNAGYPEKNRLQRSRVTELVVEALRYDTEFVEPLTGGVVALDLASSVYLASAYGGPVELRLPKADAANGHAVTVKRTDASANPLTVTETGGPGPDGRTLALGNRYDFVTLVSERGGLVDRRRQQPARQRRLSRGRRPVRAGPDPAALSGQRLERRGRGAAAGPVGAPRGRPDGHHQEVRHRRQPRHRHPGRRRRPGQRGDRAGRPGPCGDRDVERRRLAHPGAESMTEGEDTGFPAFIRGWNAMVELKTPPTMTAWRAGWRPAWPGRIGGCC